MKSMQVDHKQPKSVNGTDDFENLMPSCRSCNYCKSTLSVEIMRQWIKDIERKLPKVSIFGIALRFGMVTWHEKWDGLFYFEKMEGK